MGLSSGTSDRSFVLVMLHGIKEMVGLPSLFMPASRPPSRYNEADEADNRENNQDRGHYHEQYHDHERDRDRNTASGSSIAGAGIGDPPETYRVLMKIRNSMSADDLKRLGKITSNSSRSQIRRSRQRPGQVTSRRESLLGGDVGTDANVGVDVDGDSGSSVNTPRRKGRSKSVSFRDEVSVFGDNEADEAGDMDMTFTRNPTPKLTYPGHPQQQQQQQPPEMMIQIPQSQPQAVVLYDPHWHQRPLPPLDSLPRLPPAAEHQQGQRIQEAPREPPPVVVQPGYINQAPNSWSYNLPVPTLPSPSAILRTMAWVFSLYFVINFVSLSSIATVLRILSSLLDWILSIKTHHHHYQGVAQPTSQQPLGEMKCCNLTALCPVLEPVAPLVSEGVIDVRLYERVLKGGRRRTRHSGSLDVEDEDEENGEGDEDDDDDDDDDDENDDDDEQLFEAWDVLQSSVEEDPFSVMQGLITISQSVASELDRRWTLDPSSFLFRRRHENNPVSEEDDRSAAMEDADHNEELGEKEINHQDTAKRAAHFTTPPTQQQKQRQQSSPLPFVLPQLQQQQYSASPPIFAAHTTIDQAAHEIDSELRTIRRALSNASHVLGKARTDVAADLRLAYATLTPVLRASDCDMSCLWHHGAGWVRCTLCWWANNVQRPWRRVFWARGWWAADPQPSSSARDNSNDDNRQGVRGHARENQQWHERDDDDEAREKQEQEEKGTERDGTDEEEEKGEEQDDELIDLIYSYPWHQVLIYTRRLAGILREYQDVVHDMVESAAQLVHGDLAGKKLATVFVTGLQNMECYCNKTGNDCGKKQGEGNYHHHHHQENKETVMPVAGLEDCVRETFCIPFSTTTTTTTTTTTGRGNSHCHSADADAAALTILDYEELHRLKNSWETIMAASTMGQCLLLRLKNTTPLPSSSGDRTFSSSSRFSSSFGSTCSSLATTADPGSIGFLSLLRFAASSPSSTYYHQGTRRTRGAATLGVGSRPVSSRNSQPNEDIILRTLLRDLDEIERVALSHVQHLHVLSLVYSGDDHALALLRLLGLLANTAGALF
ncbi:hypothetical protein CHU98_g10666 [Xylaria longipes]|nr:hypothetical protein CHU98_g10666 [Xylaria longipes]